MDIIIALRNLIKLFKKSRPGYLEQVSLALVLRSALLVIKHNNTAFSFPRRGESYTTGLRKFNFGLICPEQSRDILTGPARRTPATSYHHRPWNRPESSQPQPP